MTRRQRILHRLTWLLVATIGVIAFTASFEAIADYAGQVGWGPRMKYAAPLLVDTFTVAAGLVILARAEAGVRAVYAWTLLIAAAAVSIGLNIAHAPPHLAARVVAALPPAALLSAVELAMSEARRSRETPTSESIRESAQRVGERERQPVLNRAAAPAAKPAPDARPGVGERVPGVAPTLPRAPAAPATSPRVRSSREAPAPGGSTTTPAPDAATERVRAIREHLREHPGASTRDVKAMLGERGISVGNSGRFNELVARIKAESNGSTQEQREQVRA